MKQDIQSLRRALEDAKTYFLSCDMQSNSVVSTRTAAASNALRSAFIYITEVVLLTCEMTSNDHAFASSTSSTICHLIKLATEQIDTSASSLLLQNNIDLEEGRIFLIDPLNLNTVGTLIPQRLESLLAVLQNLKRVVLSAVHKSSSSKISESDVENAYMVLTQSFMNIICVMDKAL